VRTSVRDVLVGRGTAVSAGGKTGWLSAAVGRTKFTEAVRSGAPSRERKTKSKATATISAARSPRSRAGDRRRGGPGGGPAPPVRSTTGSTASIPRSGGEKKS